MKMIHLSDSYLIHMGVSNMIQLADSSSVYLSDSNLICINSLNLIHMSDSNWFMSNSNLIHEWLEFDSYEFISLSTSHVSDQRSSRSITVWINVLPVWLRALLHTGVTDHVSESGSRSEQSSGSRWVSVPTLNKPPNKHKMSENINEQKTAFHSEAPQAS